MSRPIGYLTFMIIGSLSIFYIFSYESFGKMSEQLYYAKGEFVYEYAEINDLIVLKGNSKYNKYFKVIGRTNTHSLCVQYGKDGSQIPSDIDSVAYNSNGHMKSYQWPWELISNGNIWADSFSILSQSEILDLSKNYKIYAFNPLKRGGISFNPLFTISFEIFILLFLVLMMLLYSFFESLFQNRFILRHIFSLSLIVMCSFFISWVMSGMGLFTEIFIVVYVKNIFSIAIYYLIIRYVRKHYQRESFVKQEFLKIIFICFFGFITELLGINLVNYIIFEWLESTGDIRFEFTAKILDWYKWWLYFGVAGFFHNLFRYIISLRRKSRQLQSLTAEAMISADALQQSEAHVNTHFLYNSLHAIAALAPIAPDKTETLALSLAKYYRYTTNRNDEVWISITEDVEALSAYLEVEKIRMGEKLSYTFDISEDAGNIQIPKFLLQPLVENAVKYGYDSYTNLTKITIKAIRIEENRIKIIVCDCGKPFEDNMEIGTGLRNVKDLLKRFYPDRHSISFINEPDKCVEIVLTLQNN